MILHELISYDVLRLIWWALMGVLLWKCRALCAKTRRRAANMRAKDELPGAPGRLADIPILIAVSA